MIKRLVSLLSRGAQLEAAAEAALKQAEGASRAAKNLMVVFVFLFSIFLFSKLPSAKMRPADSVIISVELWECSLHRDEKLLWNTTVAILIYTKDRCWCISIPRGSNMRSFEVYRSSYEINVFATFNTRHRYSFFSIFIYNLLSSITVIFSISYFFLSFPPKEKDCGIIHYIMLAITK